MEELNKVVRAIGSFIVTGILFACPIVTAFILKTKHMNFLGFMLLIVSLAEFSLVLLFIYFSSEER